MSSKQLVCPEGERRGEEGRGGERMAEHRREQGKGRRACGAELNPVYHTQDYGKSDYQWHSSIGVCDGHDH